MKNSRNKALAVTIIIVAVLIIAAGAGLAVLKNIQSTKPQGYERLSIPETQRLAEDLETAPLKPENENISIGENWPQMKDETFMESGEIRAFVGKVPDEEKGIHADGLRKLENDLRILTEGFEGSWSVYVKQLPTGESISLESRPMKAASLIKLFIMEAVFSQVESGILSEDEHLDTLLWQMITVSDNEAANTLVCLLSDTGAHGDGMAVLNAYLQDQGYADTRQERPLQDAHHELLQGENYTSVNDCGALLERIYKGTCINESFSEAMEEMLLASERRWKIPAGLPEHVKCANKTGELSDVENDTAIVYSDHGDYILCIMSENLTDTNEAQINIRMLSRTVYEYFNQEEINDVNYE